MVDPSGKVAPPTGEVASTGTGVDPPLRPQLPDHPGLEKGGPPLTVRVRTSGAEQTFS